MKNLILFLFCIVTINVKAQHKTIIGKITNSKDGSVLAGVKIHNSDYSKNTVSNASGEYKIELSSYESPIFTLYGFTIKSIRVLKVTNENVIDVEFESNVQNPSEKEIINSETKPKNENNLKKIKR
jgi:TonB-dependent starch-binding outer membrane protein SusC